MLLVRCSACKAKLFKYRKLGQGEVLRCHHARITKWLQGKDVDGDLHCPCGRRIGIGKPGHYSMVRNAFKYSGEKEDV